MGLFIELAIDRNKCIGIAKCGLCIEVCPVSVFTNDSGNLKTNTENEDECTLCNLCIQKCQPAALSILKKY